MFPPFPQLQRSAPVFTLLSQQICTPRNLTVISAQAKGGKSAMIGFPAAAHEGRAVALFDTGQSLYDAWSIVQRSVQRAGITAMPGCFRGYSLADVLPAHVMSQGHRVKPGSKSILTLRVTGSQGHDLYIGRDPVNLNLTCG